MLPGFNVIFELSARVTDPPAVAFTVPASVLGMSCSFTKLAVPSRAEKVRMPLKYPVLLTVITLAYLSSGILLKIKIPLLSVVVEMEPALTVALTTGTLFSLTTTPCTDARIGVGERVKPVISDELSTTSSLLHELNKRTETIKVASRQKNKRFIHITYYGNGK
jgi:hypothetical protein